MLQKLNYEEPTEGFRADFDQESADLSHFLRPAFYWGLIKRRGVYFAIPFVLVLAVGLAAARLWPATYLSEGKILVQSQMIPTELVRATVTSAAQERIQAIQQRTMTRENLLAMIDKFHLFPDKRTLMSPTELVALMKTSTKIEPLAEPLAFSRSRSENPTIVFTVGFEYSNPQVAAQVANELVTRILNEDLRDRTSRATDTTKFLAREVQRLQADNAALDAKIAQAKLTQPDSSSSNSADPPATRLAQLKSELVQKSAIYSDKHPVMQALKRQVEAMEKAISPAALTAGNSNPGALEVLETQQESLQKDLETASTKLAAARLGETLEKDQQSEKLEVIEQPTASQDPIKPNRPKIAGISLFLALAAGGGLVLLLELADKSIRRASDLYGIIDNRVVLSIPYITTQAEQRWRKRRILLLISVAAVALVLAVIGIYFFMPPLDLMIAKARVGLFR